MRGPVVFCLNPAQNESLKNRDAADLGAMMIDSSSLKDSPGGEVVRSGGVACTVNTTNDGSGNDEFAVGLSLRLTEFPDPEGKVVFFRVPDLSAAGPDELLSGGDR